MLGVNFSLKSPAASLSERFQADFGLAQGLILDTVSEIL